MSIWKNLFTINLRISSSFLHISFWFFLFLNLWIVKSVTFEFGTDRIRRISVKCAEFINLGVDSQFRERGQSNRTSGRWKKFRWGWSHQVLMNSAKFKSHFFVRCIVKIWKPDSPPGFSINRSVIGKHFLANLKKNWSVFVLETADFLLKSCMWKSWKNHFFY
jgi:hypothetical protein